MKPGIAACKKVSHRPASYLVTGAKEAPSLSAVMMRGEMGAGEKSQALQVAIVKDDMRQCQGGERVSAELTQMFQYLWQ